MATIGIDYTPAYEQGGGIGRYVRELTSALLDVETPHDFRFFVAGVDGSVPEFRHSAATSCPTRISTKWLARIWHRAHLPLPIETFTGPLDLYHATDFVLPPTHPKTKSLLTVHDLSFLRAPETAAPRLRRYLERVVPNSVKCANHILADSEATRRDLMDVYGTSSAKITVLLSGVDQHFRPVTDQATLKAVREKYGIGIESPYIFTIGTVQPR
ncbi:MAG: glycosyltransferase, partial [Chloroflexota bacterium]